MKTSEIKTSKGKINGVESTLIKESIVDKSLGNILFCLGFEQANGYYYKAGVINVVEAAKNYVKFSKYTGGEENEMSFVNYDYAEIDQVTEVDELNRLVNQASANH